MIVYLTLHRFHSSNQMQTMDFMLCCLLQTGYFDKLILEAAAGLVAYNNKARQQVSIDLD